MNLNPLPLAAAAALMLSPALALAEEFPLQVTVEAVVPSPTGLQISPVGDWAGRTQPMRWNLSTQRLDPIQQQIDMKSGLGAIEAYLSTDALLTSAANSIALTVTVAGKVLAVGAANKAEVASSIEAAASKRVDVTIAAAAPTGPGYAQGNYQGNVFMMFESVAP
ncbi:CS1 type fimbrial major subunit [Stenotrophomonas sp.]|jgi:hypothetical protein|uniref:CS1 type fimbrial major subunit n=1 Tax=Stenotrophomonas sp. TaxID=69392 RepID=UPI0025CE82EA|nr:CS1 type fimbrial major subunit [Stenotrophomonas sp.]MBW8373990.1 hypothetical protein [Stenotrophomonas sp.]